MEAMFWLLEEMTMVVNGFRSFSHEVFRRVIFDEFLGTNEAYIRQHDLMARYFQKMPTCSRNFECLAYHLKAAGLWTKLKEALVDIENFRMWWTPAHKSEFISLWASLTCRKTFAKYFATARTKSTSDLNHYQGVRAYFDVVDEYVRSLEYYREKQNPRDEDLADVVLRIAEFLLEYAMLGHEDSADVPTFLHPTISHDDLRSIGVPVLAIDANGEARLTEPRFQGNTEAIMSQTANAPLSPSALAEIANDRKAVSTYFYNRWMWIQFPLVAIANCGERYSLGIRSVRHFEGQDQPSSDVCIAESADTLMGVDENKAVKSETERKMYLRTGDEESVQKVCRISDKLPQYDNI
ncbi:hypothetical protein Naga_100005g37 [Nannochloropsis gaditana]|uniref:Uncharacterized protein n=2 Tax=Nannochloropsis gaditana TaxID=72520 RepID=W7TEC4_9STRA|nr:hypothetical protein Naga_100005g37 [Nannochloropsis gaditana]